MSEDKTKEKCILSLLLLLLLKYPLVHILKFKNSPRKLSHLTRFCHSSLTRTKQQLPIHPLTAYPSAPIHLPKTKYTPTSFIIPPKIHHPNEKKKQHKNNCLFIPCRHIRSIKIKIVSQAH